MEPDGWVSAEETRLVIEPGGPVLYYRLGAQTPLRKGRRWREDRQGRSALEAFATLPVADMYERLAAAGAPGSQGADGLPAWSELRSFIATFGPLGLEWPRAFAVGNPEGDRAHRGEIPRPRWLAVGAAPGYGAGRVRRVIGPLHGSWDERVDRADMTLPHDVLGLGPAGPLGQHHADLIAAIRVARLLGESPAPHELRDAVGDLPRYGRYDTRERDRRTVDLVWREAATTPHGLGFVDWTPFGVHLSRIDWDTAARILLAEHLTAELAWLRPAVGLDRHHAFRRTERVHSVLEVIYLQLLEHAIDRLHFGIGECSRCGGPVLRTRRAESTMNRAHEGCAAVVRKRRQRERDGALTTVKPA